MRPCWILKCSSNNTRCSLSTTLSDYITFGYSLNNPCNTSAIRIPTHHTQGGREERGEGGREERGEGGRRGRGERGEGRGETYK